MPQEFVVLQCCQCRIYQVQQSKKATKWLCKVCNTKQSVNQFFGSGSAKDCRLAVQYLNSQQIPDENRHSCNGKPVIDANDPDIDSKILDLLLTNDENNDSSDDVSIPKKQKMTETDDRNRSVESSTGLLWTNANQLVTTRRVSKWNQFVK